MFKFTLGLTLGFAGCFTAMVIGSVILEEERNETRLNKS